ncbi:FxsA family protein [Antrihabitans cavernicola]|uniref:FxsA family protein n=1 Tax=Antrihabitans cavernicola TaxID=2495913 RepID=A0A5A7S572_9NOCA|nr:FxsA family protein [Spelaeibacter cavernicola]KAA0021320.1 FxsA family protein [Spelaeibacter cavernicola]
MPILLFVAYVVAEIAAFAWAVSTIGVLWTIVLLLAGSVIGMVLVRSQGRKVFAGLRRASQGESSPTRAIADGVLVGLGAVLMFVPGLVTSVLGLLLLLPPTRMVIRPAVVLLGARRFGALAAAASAGGRVFGGRAYNSATVIDGEVVDEYPTTAGYPRYDRPAITRATVEGDTGSQFPRT